MKGVRAEDLLAESEILGSRKLTLGQWDWVQRRPGASGPDENWDKTKEEIAKEIEGMSVDTKAGVKLEFLKPTRITPTEATFQFKGTVRVKTHMRRKK